MIPISKPSLGIDELGYLSNCMKSGWISFRGSYVSEFEKSFAKYCGTEYGVACSNGTSALHLALLALGIGKGDEVIVPTLTFASTAFAVSYTGARPIFVDSEPNSWNIDTKKTEKAITRRTKAIIPVHLYGIPCDMRELLRLAMKYDLFLIEDCAEAHGATYYNQKVGSLSHISCFSFFANKIITTGEGGMCLTDSPEYYERIRLYQNYGSDRNRKDYSHSLLGYNYRMTNLQAGVGLGQLVKIDDFLSKREVIQTWYDERLGWSNIIFPHDKNPDTRDVCWIYSVRLNKTREQRNAIIKAMAEKNIETRPVFEPVHTMPMYKTGQKLPVAQAISDSGISLPTYPELTEKEVDYICKRLKECLETI